MFFARVKQYEKLFNLLTWAEHFFLSVSRNKTDFNVFCQELEPIFVIWISYCSYLLHVPNAAAQRGTAPCSLQNGVILAHSSHQQCVSRGHSPFNTCLYSISASYFSRHTFLPSGSMKISETQISDSGMYICVATNIAGNVTQSVKLSVHGKF